MFRDCRGFSIAPTFFATLLCLAPAATAQSLAPVGSIINADGTIRSGSRAGSYDARGLRMTLGSDGAPRFTPLASDPNDEYWDPSFVAPGVAGEYFLNNVYGGYVRTVLFVNDTTVIVGGSFLTAGNAPARNIAAYDPQTGSWRPLTGAGGADITGGFNEAVNCMILNGNDVYIGGNFSSAGGVPCDNIVDFNIGSGTWSPLGSGGSNGLDSSVEAMVYTSGNLYVGGNFSRAGGGAATHVARWDGSAWHPLGSGTNKPVQSLAVNTGFLYAGGQFDTAGGVVSRLLAKWDGSVWSSVGISDTDLVGHTVSAILPDGKGLYIGGEFSQVHGATANNIARWDGPGWNTIGAGVNGRVQGLLLDGGKLYVSGVFDAAGIITVNNVAAVDTNTGMWFPLGGGTTVGTTSIEPMLYPAGAWAPALVGGVLIVPGEFDHAGGAAAFGIASWDGIQWSALAPTTRAPNGPVFTVALSGSKIYVGGTFQGVGNTQANNVAVFDAAAQSWSPLGTGAANGVSSDSGLAQVLAIGISGTDVYVGGTFTKAGGQPARSIAKWDGTRWSPLGTPPNDGVDGSFNPSVSAIAVNGTGIYVGGYFDHAGGDSSSNVALWNGTAWKSLGKGVDGQISGIVAGMHEIYVGGFFLHAGGNPASYVAGWNDTAWYSLGSTTNGVDGPVFSLAGQEDTLYAAGSFLHAGGVPVQYLARWDTRHWTAFPSMVNGLVGSLELTGNSLILGGNFTSVGSKTAAHIARYNLTDGTVDSYGDGLDEGADATLVVGNDLYAGGIFKLAGGKPSFNFARYSHAGPSAVNNQHPIVTGYLLRQNFPNPFNPTTTIGYQLPRSAFVTLKVYDILGRKVATLVNEKEDPGTHAVKFDGARLASGVYFYRLVTDHGTDQKKMLLLK